MCKIMYIYIYKYKDVCVYDELVAGQWCMRSGSHIFLQKNLDNSWCTCVLCVAGYKQVSAMCMVCKCVYMYMCTYM